MYVRGVKRVDGEREMVELNGLMVFLLVLV